MDIFKDTNFPWLAERTILLAPSGSFAYGTNTDSSDKDYKGICIPPIEFYLGLQSFNEFNTTGGKKYRNTKDDIDVTITHINKFVKDAIKGVPNNLELLFMQTNDYLKVTELGKMLINNRQLFLSKRVYKKYNGYAQSQIKKLSKPHSTHTIGTEARYDTKMFMHSIRLLTSAIEILETGNFHTYHPKRQLLLDCRNGKYSFSEAMELIQYYDQKLQVAYRTSSIPEEPDVSQINNLLISINKEALQL
ncbi:nucleotidyltransferase domain-containing protein [Caldibacillus lycopersici]|uniref:Nucleotidyltransferase domain-containing protein n=1 Tax=Perspicuibacillus lycopersici TaxID=1325689 RepID=A0AAE3LPR1_9BACI|nr:nucleotidyltransferase domain-containing protein [Perspicuibacillus lycopersici]MCU9612564.1 nucleotidyltransferase domain-containing protein [Perspicuibacillus lycopersici]